MTTPIHVGIDATTWWNDRGFGRFTREMVRALAARSGRFRYTLVVDRPDYEDLPPGVEVAVARPSRTTVESAAGAGARSPADLLLISRVVARSRFDVFFFPAVYSYFPLLTRVPCVIAFHDTIAERYPELMFPTRKNLWLWRAKCALAKLQARRIMTVSQASADDVEQFHQVPRDRIDVVTEAADPIFRRLADGDAVRAVRARSGLPEAGPLFVYVGGLNPHKNLLRLLEAFPGVLKAHANAHLAVVGDTSGKGFHDNYKELKAFVDARPELGERVRFTGYISDPDLVALFSGATALVLPSLWEGFGLPAVEAMSCALPVLASRRGSLPEVVGDAGLYFDPLVPGTITASMVALLDNPELRERLSQTAIERARFFTWDRGAELAEQSFERCLEGS